MNLKNIKKSSNLHKFLGFFAILLCLITVFYTIIKYINYEPFSVIFILPICMILFLFSLYFYFKQDEKSKKQMLYFALVALLATSPFLGAKIYNCAFKEPSYLVGEIILAKKMSNLNGDVTKHIKPQLMQTIKSQNLEYLKSQGFSLNSQGERTVAFFKGVVKMQKFAISIIIENGEVRVVAFSGYDAI